MLQTVLAMGLAPELEYSALEYSVDLALLERLVAIEVGLWGQGL